jgi:hypothetical protein
MAMPRMIQVRMTSATAAMIRSMVASFLLPRSTRENRKVAITDPKGPPIFRCKNGGAVQE